RPATGHTLSPPLVRRAVATTTTTSRVEYMKSTKLLLACAAALSLGSMAQATEVGRWYGTGQIGALFTDDDRNLTSSDRLFGLSIGKHMNESWSLELNANGAKLGSL